MWILFKKEIKGFFSSLTGYVVILVFLLANSSFIWLFRNPLNLVANGYATLDSLFVLAPWIFLFLVPAITMRMISEERRSGTMELLRTRPVSELQIVFAKFLASWILVLLSLLPTLVWFWSVSRLGSPVGNMDMGGTWGSYLGLLFLGGIYAAIGIFCSSITGNQIVAFIIAVLLSFVMFRGFAFMGDSLGSGKMALVVSRAGIAYHYSSMSRGVLDSRDMLYFAIVITLFLQAARSVLQSQNWQRRNLVELTSVLLVVLLVAVISGMKFFRADLTSEKKYTLSHSSREALEGLDGVVFVRIYLEGEMPSEFVNFRNHIEDLMDECRAWAGENLLYEFVNLYDEPDEEIQGRMIGQLYDQGLNVTSIQVSDGEGGKTARIVFPGAMVSYGDYTLPVNLLKNNPSLSHEMNLNNSIQTLEYEFMRAIHSLTMDEVPRIAFIEGHGELDSLQTHGLMDELKNFFQVDRGFISGNVEALKEYKALIVARPTRPFSEADKFAIDQYIMSGGKVLFFLDPVNPFADSLAGGTTVALANQVGLEDLLFKYGVRINYNLVADLQCSAVPVNTASGVEQPRWTLMPWVYYPLLSGNPTHPVTRGLNHVKGEFASSLDTVGTRSRGVSATVLLSTSSSSRSREVPLYLSMEEVTVQPDPALYNASSLPVAVLLEGVFPSLYKNYPVPGGVYPGNTEVLPESSPTSVLVVTDGNIPANEVRLEQGYFVAEKLGYDRYTKQTFGNPEFVMNAINQMTDDTGIMELRSREFKLRLLNREITAQPERVLTWKLINSIVPLLLVISAGIFLQFARRRRYSQ
ncbi:MAG: gliding motility-associated ABC transporter substrate-binding protein GldG [Bacteroidetes bacterium]|nr:gliding motility-associated ABC transporter substrate-binding protein GldG [Bacteroidota bacterium]